MPIHTVKMGISDKIITKIYCFITDKIKYGSAGNYRKSTVLVDNVLRMSIRQFRKFIEVLGSPEVNQLHVAKLFVQESEGELFMYFS